MKPYNTDQSKKEEVREMFDNIAPKYDLLNHALSMSIDRLWRRHVVKIVCRVKPRRILDVATGTGDLAIAMARRIRETHVLGVDLSERMLDVARRKVEARGLDGRIVLDHGDAEHLDVATASVDVATVAFGVRNFGDLDAGLRELARVLRPGGGSSSWSSRDPRTRCSAPSTNSIPTGFCPASAAWSPTIAVPTSISRPRSANSPARPNFCGGSRRPDSTTARPAARVAALPKYILVYDETIVLLFTATLRRPGDGLLPALD